MGVFVFNRSKRQLGKALEGCRPRLSRMALAWTRDPEAAKDLVQEVVRRARKGARQPLDPGSLHLHLLRMLSECWYERLWRDHPTIPRDEIVQLDGSDPGDTDWQGGVTGRVQAEIARLPVAQRQVVTLADLECLSYADIAKVLAMPTASVPVHLSHARANLRDALGPEISRHRRSNGCCVAPGAAGERCWWQAARDRVVRQSASPVVPR